MAQKNQKKKSIHEWFHQMILWQPVFSTLIWKAQSLMVSVSKMMDFWWVFKGHPERRNRKERFLPGFHDVVPVVYTCLWPIYTHMHIKKIYTYTHTHIVYIYIYVCMALYGCNVCYVIDLPSTKVKTSRMYHRLVHMVIARLYKCAGTKGPAWFTGDYHNQ